MQGKEGVIGLFLIIMGISMFLMCLVYYKTSKMKYAWMAFGFLYTIGILMLMTNNPIKTYLNVSSNSRFYSIPSLIILMIGIMLSFILLSNKGEKYVISGILFSVGIHFIPFNSIYTMILSGLVSLNAIYSFVKKDSLLIDYLEKIIINTDFKRWYFGHYHDNKAINDKEMLLYEQLIRAL